MNEYRHTPTEFLKCRGFLHSWDEFVSVGKRKQLFGDRVSLLCVSCGSERHDIYDTYGVIQARDYVYPDGYPGSLPMREAKLLYLKRKKDRRTSALRPGEATPLRAV